jgi:hypothetical protein
MFFFFFFFFYQIGEIKKLVNLFLKNSKISQIYTRKHTLQNFLNLFAKIRTKKIQERKKEIGYVTYILWRSHVVMGHTKDFLSLVE